MKHKIIHIIIIALNVLCITGIIILTVTGHYLAGSQKYNNAYRQWADDEEYTQISCFLAEDSGFSTDSIQAVRAELIKALQGASIAQDGKKLCPDAYSSSFGTATVKCDISGHSEAEITAVGGDFFLFRNFRLLDGAYFSENDLMQDGAVIDRDLAWALYGSENISGMNIYINNLKFYISGVIDTPQTKAEKACSGELPKLYISYDGASQLALLSDSSDNGESFRKITCYECIMPNPVEKFAYNTISGFFSESYKEKYTLTDNAERFSPSERAEEFRQLWNYAVKDNAIKYPYWENASRIIEFRLSSVYFFRNLLYIPPALTLIWLIIILRKTAKIKKKQLFSAIAYKINKKIYDNKQKKANIKAE